MKKFLLPGMVAALAFAACTNEEIVSQQQAAPEVDLSQRPVVGMVDLNFGPQSQTRMGLGEGYNGFAFKPGDKLGARLIDKVVTPVNSKLINRQFYYGADDSRAHTNYAYVRNEAGLWGTEALLVEGNYMFYAPYNENDRGRGPLEVTFPINQVVNPTSEQVALEKGGRTANVDAVKTFFKGEVPTQTAFIGHYFLDASKSEFEISPAYNHLYAYPAITLVNDYEVTVNGVTSAKDVTIDRVIINSDNIHSDYTVKHSGVMAALQNAVSEKVAGVRVPYTQSLGAWRTKDGANAKNFLMNADTEDILTPKSGSNTKNGTIVVDFNPDLTIKAGESFAFHVVMPAAAYNDLQIVPVEKEAAKVEWTWGDCSFVEPAAGYTFAPGMWCPTEEYNMEGSVPAYKATAGTLGQFSIKGAKVRYNEPAKDLKYAGQLANWLEENNFDHSVALVESAETFTFAKEERDIDGDGKPDGLFSVVLLNDSLVNIVEKYLVTGSIEFESNMLATGNLNIDGGKYIFGGGLDQLDGKLTLKGADIVTDGLSLFKGETDFNNVKFQKLSNNESENQPVQFNGKATLNGVTAGAATIKGAGSVIKGASDLGTTTITKSTDIQGSATATSWTIKGEDVVVNYTSTGTAKPITVSEEATLNMSNAYGSTITVGATNSDNVMTKGIVNLAAAPTATVTLTMGDVTVNGSLATSTLTWNDDYETTLTNNGKITGTLSVPANGTYMHYGTVEAVTVDADGVIENYGDIVVTSNMGLVKAMNDATHTTVKAGNGTVGNDYLAYVDASAAQTVYYTFPGDVKDADLIGFDPVTYDINKLIFKGKVTLSDLGTKPIMFGVTAVEFENGSSLKVNANGEIGLNITTVDIDGNVAFSGFAKDMSGIGFEKGATININAGAVLTVSYLTMVTLDSQNGLNFNLKSESEKADGVLEINNSVVGLGMAAAPAHTIDDLSTITNSYYDGTSLVNQASAAINAALNNANVPVVRLIEDLNTGSAFTISRTVTVEMNGKNITMKNSANAGVFTVTRGGELTIQDSEGTSVISAVGTAADIASNAVRAIGGEVIIKSGTFQAYDDKAYSSNATGNTYNNCIYADEGGEITIEGGKFEYKGSHTDGHKFLLNCKDKSSAEITVNGGYFYNHVPSYEAVAPETYVEVVLGAGKTVKKWSWDNNKATAFAPITAHSGGNQWYTVQ